MIYLTYISNTMAIPLDYVENSTRLFLNTNILLSK